MAEVTDWRQAWLVYAQPRIVAMLCLGFSAGLPFLLVFSTLSAWLTEAGVSRTAIGLFSWVGITYSIKVLWAPVVDRLELPLLHRLLGRRRSWILLAQLAIAAGLLGMAQTDPLTDLAQMAVFAVLVAFGAATQDIAIDAWRIEAAPPEQQAAMAATYVFAYRLALLAAGAGALHIATFMSWTGVYVCMAGLMGIGMLAVLCSREPNSHTPRDTVFLEARVQDFMTRNAHLPPTVRNISGWLIGAVVCPFVDFFARNGRWALTILALIGLYRVTDITMGVMANPFYLDLGFTKAQIANISGIYGVAMTVLGGLLGGLLVPRWGVMRILLLGAVMAAATNLLFAVLALLGPQIWMLVVTISADNLAGGLAISAFIAYLSSLTNSAYTATQYALFSSLMTLPGKVIGGAAGAVVDAAGYPLFFVYSCLIGVPAVLVVLYLMRNPPPATLPVPADEPPEAAALPVAGVSRGSS
jgi:MFS transporter, PAT family, beta-lactamase induction signal transducer AmpG